jgi:small subunit ribosomal protein S21|tara:strand:+ start:277 stop:522 length:246 start_codon:yes stop_codon:yes gene_type:complete
LRRNNNRDDRQKQGLRVEVRNGDVNFALRKFKKKIQEDGILQELRERQHFTKPSEKRKKAKAAGRARWLKKLRNKANEQGY